MISRLMRWLLPERVRIVSVERAKEIPPLDADSARSITMLAEHPGFKYLLARLRIQRSYLEQKLLHERQASMTDVEFLKAGIAWSRWLEVELASATRLQKPPQPVEATELEAQAFKAIQDSLELVGR